MVKELKCIRDRCDEYIYADHYTVCCLADYIIEGECECIGLKHIPDEKERLAFKISKLSNEIDRLELLEELIKANQ